MRRCARCLEDFGTLPPAEPGDDWWDDDCYPGIGDWCKACISDWSRDQRRYAISPKRREQVRQAALRYRARKRMSA